jgi:SAM-dependent methyltransferase
LTKQVRLPVSAPAAGAVRSARSIVILFGARMKEAELDKFAEEYRQLHSRNIRLSGEDPEFFAEYKVRQVAALLGEGAERKALRVLDFGAGTGNSVPHFRRLLPCAQLTCLDVSVKSLALGESRYAGAAEFRHFDGRTIPYSDGCFDLGFAACVFHHIDAAEHRALLTEFHRVLRPAGQLVVFEHNPFNPLTVRAVNTCPFDENAVLIRAGELVQRFQEAGFVAIQRRYCVFFPGPLRALRFLERYLGWLPLGAQYFVTGRKHAAS